MTFAEINIDEIINKGYDKMLIMRNGEMFLGGRISNILIHRAILDSKKIVNQFGDQGVWVLEIED